MTAKKWGNAINNGAVQQSPSEEIKALRELLVEKGVITDDEAKPRQKKKAVALV